MKLTWSTDNPKYLYLFAGDHETAIATLTKAKKWWEAWVDLPGVSPDKRYGPLDRQKADVETKVRRWFEDAWTDAPKAEVTHMAELRWDNSLMTPQGALEMALQDVRAGKLEADKLAVLALDTRDGDYNPSYYAANIKASELVTLCTYFQLHFTLKLRGE